MIDVLLQGQSAWNIPFLGIIACIAASYGFFVKRFTNVRLYHKQPLFFFSCLALLCLTIGSPISVLNHFSFSLHMIQMSIHYFIVPPLILLGIPTDLYDQMRNRPWIKKIRKLPLSPKNALFIFALLFLMYHLPVVLNAFSQHAFIHNGYLILLFLLSLCMWWPIASPDPGQKYGGIPKKRFAFLSGIVLMPACILFILTALIDGMDNPFLSQLTAHLCTPSQSSSFKLLPSPFNTKFDQLTAGILMLGMHKFGIMLTFRLGGKLHD